MAGGVTRKRSDSASRAPSSLALDAPLVGRSQFRWYGAIGDLGAVARRPNETGWALLRSDNHAGAFPSIQHCASCCEMKPGIWSRLPLGQATRTYHPQADLRRRASKAGFEFGSSMIRNLRDSTLHITRCSSFYCDFSGRLAQQAGIHVSPPRPVEQLSNPVNRERFWPDVRQPCY
jgi:hypothetical protein